MKCLRVTAAGDHTAFRQPWTEIGRLLTYPMPPPATLFGHISAAWGGKIPENEAAGLEVGYEFRYASRVFDMERYHKTIAKPRGVSITTDKMEREFLAFWELVMYINKPAWETVFKTPKNTVRLGRSGDLAEYVDVVVVDLVSADLAEFQHGALLDADFAATGAEGTLHLLPVGYDDPQTHQGRHINPFFLLELPYTIGGTRWTDPTRVNDKGVSTGVHWISFANAPTF